MSYGEIRVIIERWEATAMSRKLGVSEIKDGVYLLNEFDGANCYLVTGTDSALLIDCGTGVGDLKGTVESITQLPLKIIATHGHVDHIGGAGAFKEVFVHRDDCRFINKIQFSLPARKLFVSTNGAMKSNGISAGDVIKSEYKTKFIPIDDGFSLNLGGKIILVKHTPGHSVGSVAIIDEADKIVFSGDNVCDALWLHLPGSASVEEWLPSARWLLEMSRSYEIYWGHRNPKLTTEYIAQVVRWGEELLVKYKKNTPFLKYAKYPDRPDGILYKTNRIHKK